MPLDGTTFTMKKEVAPMSQAPAATLLRERAERGSRFLDKHAPRWRRRINWDRLSIGDAKWCILGQLFGTFTDGRRLLDLTPAQSIALGFDTDETEQYSILTKAWQKILATDPG